jgi:Raf kinase inhibitor-like YbhB/YbcL family protein
MSAPVAMDHLQLRKTAGILARSLRSWPAMLPLLAVGLSACSRPSGNSPPPPPARAATIQLTSPAFADGAPIPVRHTCDDADRSPALQWRDVAAGAKTMALICEDPDAPGGTWSHWVVYGLPASAAQLPEGIPKSEQVPGGGRQGVNDFHRPGYAGPCPPPGSPHHYVFRIYALDTDFALKPGATRADLLRAMEGHLLAQGQLTGTYARR